MYVGKHSSMRVCTARCVAMPGHSAFSMKKQLGQYLVFAPPAPMIGPLDTMYIVFFMDNRS